MQRETTTFTTPYSKQVVVVKTYLTGREKRQLQNALLNTGELQFNIDTKKIEGISGALADKEQDTLWALIVDSIDGKADDIVNTILDMRSEDYEFVVKKINDINAGISEEKKTI